MSDEIRINHGCYNRYGGTGENNTCTNPPSLTNICAECKVACYCSSECHDIDIGAHEDECPRLKKALESNQEPSYIDDTNKRILIVLEPSDLIRKEIIDYHCKTIQFSDILVCQNFVKTCASIKQLVKEAILICDKVEQVMIINGITFDINFQSLFTPLFKALQSNVPILVFNFGKSPKLNLDSIAEIKAPQPENKEWDQWNISESRVIHCLWTQENMYQPSNKRFIHQILIQNSNSNDSSLKYDLYTSSINKLLPVSKKTSLNAVITQLNKDADEYDAKIEYFAPIKSPHRAILISAQSNQDNLCIRMVKSGTSCSKDKQIVITAMDEKEDFDIQTKFKTLSKFTGGSDMPPPMTALYHMLSNGYLNPKHIDYFKSIFAPSVKQKKKDNNKNEYSHSTRKTSKSKQKKSIKHTKTTHGSTSKNNSKSTKKIKNKEYYEKRAADYLPSLKRKEIRFFANHYIVTSNDDIKYEVYPRNIYQSSIPRRQDKTAEFLAKVKLIKKRSSTKKSQRKEIQIEIVCKVDGATCASYDSFAAHNYRAISGFNRAHLRNLSKLDRNAAKYNTRQLVGATDFDAPRCHQCHILECKLNEVRRVYPDEIRYCDIGLCQTHSGDERELCPTDLIYYCPSKDCDFDACFSCLDPLFGSKRKKTGIV